MRKSLVVGLLPSLGAAIALLSVFPAAALVGGAPKANQSIARYVVMVVGSDKTFCSGYAADSGAEADLTVCPRRAKSGLRPLSCFS